MKRAHRDRCRRPLAPRRSSEPAARTWRTAGRRVLLAATLLAALAPSPAPAQTAAPANGPLFPQAFVVEHYLVRTDPDGSRFESEPVVDHYGGSWIVSVRSDGSRLVVDLDRRELTEIRPERGTYSVLSFDRLAEVQRRLAELEARHLPQAAGRPRPGANDGEEPEIVVREVAARAAGSPDEVPAATRALLARPGVMHLEVSSMAQGAARTAGAAGLEVWLDPSIRLSAAAREALSRFERALAGATPARGVAPGPARLLAVARDHAGGAFPVRTFRRLGEGGAGTAASSEDVAVRLEPLAALPRELIEVPEGLHRTAHPLELLVAFEEQEAEHEPPPGEVP